MANSTEHFMWGFQQQFRTSQQGYAEIVFQTLDPKLRPEVFLVGVRDTGETNRPAACVVPETDFWIHSEAFDGVLKAAIPLVATYPEAQLAHTDAIMQSKETERLRRRAVSDAILKIIKENPGKPPDMVYHVSLPIKRDGHLIAIVLGLQSHVLRSHPHLLIDRLFFHEYRMPIATISLIHAAVGQFFGDSVHLMSQPDAGESGRQLRPPLGLLQMAGMRFMMDCAFKGTGKLIDTLNSLAMFDTCNSIAGMKHERAVGKGRLVIAGEGHEALKKIISFATPPNIKNARAARKLLELASQGAALHVDPTSIYGVVEVADYNAEQENLFEVNFLDHHHWELAHAGQTLMHVRSGQPSLPSPPFNHERLRADLIRVFEGISPGRVEQFVKIVNAASDERHGTMLVIVQDAAEEAKRLAKQATCIHPCPVTQEIIPHATPIDGAVLLGPDAVCHAIGVILDGMATDEGDPARGARYNSALRYVRTHKAPCMAIVVSEDGGIDLISSHPQKSDNLAVLSSSP